MKSSATVDEFISNHPDWENILTQLRHIILETGLVETIKWGAPTYTYDGKNVVGLGVFKSYAGLWFFQGALLGNKEGKLINAQEGKTKALRQWRIFSMDEIEPNLIKAYILEAIDNHKRGKEIRPIKNKPLIIPPELQEALKQDRVFENSFNSFSKGKQREFAEYIQKAKRVETKTKRLHKIIPLIKKGVGLNDQYRSS